MCHHLLAGAVRNPLFLYGTVSSETIERNILLFPWSAQSTAKYAPQSIANSTRSLDVFSCFFTSHQHLTKNTTHHCKWHEGGGCLCI